MRQPPGRQTHPALSENEVHSSNATLNTLFAGSRGARQKSWMSGQAPVRPTPRRTSTSGETTRPSILSQETQSPSLNQSVVLPLPNPSQHPNIVSNHARLPAETAPAQSLNVSVGSGSVSLSSPNGYFHGALDRQTHSTMPAPVQPFDQAEAASERTRQPLIATQMPTATAGQPVASGLTHIDLLQSPSPESMEPPSAEGTASVPLAQPFIRSVYQNRSPQDTTHPSSQSLQSSTLELGSLTNTIISERRQRSQQPSMPPLYGRVALIEEHLAFYHMSQPLPELERIRFILLKEACMKEDSFYVAVHQLYCAWELDQRKLLSTLVELSPILQSPSKKILSTAFLHLPTFLRSNTMLSAHHWSWFVDFPSPLTDLLRVSEPYRRVMQDVFRFLTRIAEDFSQYIKDCLNRNYPPLVEELVNRLCLHSPILQKIAFTAIRRHSNVPDEPIGQEMEVIFLKDQEEHRALSARMSTNRPPTAREVQERRARLAGAYGSLLNRASLSQPPADRIFNPSRHQNPAPSDPRSQSVQNPHLIQPNARYRPIRSSLGSREVANEGASLDISAAAQAIVLNSPNIDNRANFGGPSSRPSVNPQHRQNSNPLLQQHSNIPVQILSSNSGSNITYPTPRVFQDQPASDVPNHATLTQQHQQVSAQLRQIEDELRKIEAVFTRITSSQTSPSLLNHQQGLLQQRATLQHTQIHLGQMLLSQHHHNGSDQQTTNFPSSAVNQPVRHEPMHQHQARDSHPQDQAVAGNLPFPSTYIAPIQAARGGAQNGQSRLDPHQTHNEIQSRRNDHFATASQSSTSLPVAIAQSPSLNAPPSFTRGSPHNQLLALPPSAAPTQYHSQPPLNSTANEIYRATPFAERTVVPPLGYIHRPSAPNPEMTALHQAHLRSPILVPKDEFLADIPKTHPSCRFYQIITGFAAPPTKLLHSVPVKDVVMTIPHSAYSLISRARPKERSGSAEQREFVRGSLQYRMRCVKKRSPNIASCIEADWTVSETVWPENAVFHVCHRRNMQNIELRRKFHHSKDLPVDLTAYFRSFRPDEEIKISISIPGKRMHLKEASYFFAVEVIAIFGHDELVTQAQKHRRPMHDTIDTLRKSLAGPDLNDDDIALVSSEVTIDLTDPFTSRIFEIPVRGNDCLHRECFDLETFLLSRTSKTNHRNQPSLIDVWKCPLCNRDARPANLHVDEFLAHVRQLLQERNALHFKAIIVNKDGEWRPKPPAPVNNGKRKSTHDESDSEDEDIDERKRRLTSGSTKPAPVVIDLSD